MPNTRSRNFDTKATLEERNHLFLIQSWVVLKVISKSSLHRCGNSR